MKMARIKLIDKLYYTPLKSGHYDLYILSVFLMEVGSEPFWILFYNMFKNHETEVFSSQLIIIRKIENSILMIFYFDYEKYEKEPEEYSLTIPIPELLSVMEQWRDVTKNLPPFIIITEDNGKYTLKASNE